MTDLIVDGNSLFARSWFASQKAQPDEPVVAITFALKTLLNIMHPDYNRLAIMFDRMLFSWDSEHLIKKQREPKPPEYHETRRTLQEVLSYLFKTAHYENKDHEGDDIVATAVFEADPTNELYVVSGDKDLQQLVGRNVSFFCLNTKAVLTPQFICNKWHIKRPNQLAIALAIQGDSVDNITGVRGYGPKKVQQLFSQVPKTAKFNDALSIVESQIPKDKLDEFYQSLNRTLLTANVPDVPKPADIELVSPVEVTALGIRDIIFRYQDVYRVYTREPF